MGTFSGNSYWSLRAFALAVVLVMLSAASLYAANNSYVQTELVSDQSGVAAKTDSSLVNAWGIAFHPNGFAWVADNGTGKATAYDGSGNKKAEIIIPPPAGSPSGTTAAPTGIVFNFSGFVVNKGILFGDSTFIIATEDGTISGWNQTVDPLSARLAVDNSASGAVYKGIAIAANGTARFLYATDFHNNRIDVFDTSFRPVSPSCSFDDPNMPDGFAPFGIHNVGGNLYVTYAKQDSAKHDDVKGSGLGFVDVYDADGCLIRRLVTRGQLNAPWGIAVAPANFGKFSNTVLVGNFGDGKINAFGLSSGNFRGTLRTDRGKFLMTDGLWGIAFGNGVNNQRINTLFFAAGPNDESNGLFGTIEAQ